MPAYPAPLFFPEALKSPGYWTQLGQTHGLSRKDFEWFSHLLLASHASRNQQTPPMHAEKIMLSTGTLSVQLAGCFVLSATPDNDGVILYTPYAGIKKLHSRATMSGLLKNQLDRASEEDDLLKLMSLSARKTLAAATDITVTFETIEGDIFEDQHAVIEHNQRDNDQAMIVELQKLPTLNELLERVLKELLKNHFPGLDQRRTQVSFYAESASNPDAQNPTSRRFINVTSLSEALLSYYRHQRWPTGQRVEFSHPQRQVQAADQQVWEKAIKHAADDLISLLSTQMQQYWNQASVDGATRRDFFSRAIVERARAELLLKREDEIITPEQWLALDQLIKPTQTGATLTIETVRLWENRANYVELAGSLMISQDNANAFLYTPAKGLQVLKDYQDLQATLRKKSIVAGHDDELYDLMSLEERERFIGFDEPQVSGAVINGQVFTTLFEAIITKQQQNLEFAFQVFRHSDGAVNIQAYFDKALDIRSLIGEQLLTVQTQGRWSTRPVLSGEQPSMVLEDTAERFVKTFQSVESAIGEEFNAQPLSSLAIQREHLAHMEPRLAHSLSVGVRGEAELRVLSGTLRNSDWVIVDTIFNPDRPDRERRPAVRGFYPDAFSLVLECAGDNEVLRLANCVLLTERGGLDIQHSGRAILWTPAAGLEVFASVASARQQLNLRLLDPDERLVLLENLSPVQRKHHRRYSLDSLRLIEGDVLRYLAQSGIELYLARCEQVRSLTLPSSEQTKALETLKRHSGIALNLHRATQIAQAINRRQSLPSWLGLAPTEEQRLHIELLEQYRHSVTDDKDYLHGLQTLDEYVHQKLKTLLTTRFPKETIDPDLIEITPNLALAGPAQTLTQFALNHANIAQGTGFQVSSAARQSLPEELNHAAITQLLLSLNIQRDYGKYITEALSGSAAAPRLLQFAKQVPWQLLQHAHALKLQRHLSADAFDLISQVLDMPDDIARASVTGAHAIVRPLELIKTTGATAVQAKGLYLISPGAGNQGSHILYAPYSPASLFTEFATETDVVAAINTPGALQDLIVRRLPQGEQASFKNLLQTSVGELSEITLASTPIIGNLFTQLFHDNTHVLTQMLGSQSQAGGQSDWDATRELFSSGIKLIASHLPGKLAYVRFLWQAFEDAMDSAEALQGQHWTRALRSFIAGAAQIVTLGALSLEDLEGLKPASAYPVKTTVDDPQWSQIKPTAAKRTDLQPFEALTVALKDLTKKPADGLYEDRISKRLYAPVAGKVYEVAKPGAVWQMNKAGVSGRSLLITPNQKMVLNPDHHTVHLGKAMSKMVNEYITDRETRRFFNVEFEGMSDIRAYQPYKARAIVQAIDMARYYAFNCLHNLVQARHLVKGTRLDTFLKMFFDVTDVDTPLLDKIATAVIPLCKALVNSDEDLLNTERFVVGTMLHPTNDTAAFVIKKDKSKKVFFAQGFFFPQLTNYISHLTEPFDVDGHAQASILIHEFAHHFSNAIDITYMEARRPFSDLISPITGYGAAIKSTQETFQREALSMATPRDELFARWNSTVQTWVSIDSVSSMESVGAEVLKITGSRDMNEARNAFRSRANPEARIAIILRNADSIAHLICQMGRQLDPGPTPTP